MPTNPTPASAVAKVARHLVGRFDRLEYITALRAAEDAEAADLLGQAWAAATVSPVGDDLAPVAAIDRARDVLRDYGEKRYGVAIWPVALTVTQRLRIHGVTDAADIPQHVRKEG